MTKHTTNEKTRQTSKRLTKDVTTDKRRAKSNSPDNVTNEMAAEKSNTAPIVDKPADRGDLEEETLDRDAPYNKTYGLKE